MPTLTTWEAAIRHVNKVSVSSSFLMEIDKGCLQPIGFRRLNLWRNTLALF